MTEDTLFTDVILTLCLVYVYGDKWGHTLNIAKNYGDKIPSSSYKASNYSITVSSISKHKY